MNSLAFTALLEFSKWEVKGDGRRLVAGRNFCGKPPPLSYFQRPAISDNSSKMYYLKNILINSLFCFWKKN